MTRAYLAFTEKGLALAQKLAGALPGTVARCGHGGPGLADWAAEQFAHADALIFVGAVGIAVRAIAPYCRSKAVDPAVVVLDECGHFAVPILSGHLGGANDLARALAAVCGAVPAITTATDANGVFAVDAWARHQNCAVLEPGRIKRVSSRLLAGGPVRYRSEFPIAGQAPAGVVPAGEAERADFALTLFPAGDALHLIPKIGVLGIGCRRGTSTAQLEAAFAQFCAAHGLAAACITAAASIDLKADEPGLLEFCRIHGWPVQFYSAAQLQNAPGQFTPSAFVRSVTGVDNVCERAAVLAEWLRGLDYTALKKLLACNDGIAELNFRRFQEMDLRRPGTPALLSYDGIQYQYMAPHLFTRPQFEYAETHLRILSGFYGVLRPFDGVLPYRLEMGARCSTPFCKSLYDFWGDSLYRTLTAGGEDTLLNLASAEYAKAVRPWVTPPVRWIDVTFGETDGDKVVEKGVYVKMARGEMVRFLAERNAETPEAAQGFDRLGYRFSPAHSTAASYVFLREGRAN